MTKLSASGTALAYSSYLGGSNHEEAHGIAVDGAGSVYPRLTTDTDAPMPS